MAHQRKLGRTADQRKALLRNQVTNLIWYGRIETTEAKAKEVRRIADRMITLAIKECDNNVQTTKQTHNDKGQLMTLEVVNDAPSKLHARRLMMAYLYDLKEQKKADENKKDYKERTKDNKHPVVEKLFREIGPKYKARNAEKNCSGGYTRIYKLGTPSRRCCGNGDPGAGVIRSGIGKREASLSGLLPFLYASQEIYRGQRKILLNMGKPTVAKALWACFIAYACFCTRKHSGAPGPALRNF